MKTIHKLLFFILLFMFLWIVLEKTAGYIMDRKYSHSFSLFIGEGENGNRDQVYCYRGPGTDVGGRPWKEVKAEYMSLSEMGNAFIDNDPDECIVYPEDVLSESLRGKDIRRRSEGEKIVALIGDSFTFGLGVPYGKAFPELIDAGLEAKGRPGGWKVYSMSKSGLDFPEAYELSFKNALEVGANAIVYVWLLNDVPKSIDIRRYPGVSPMNDFILNVIDPHSSGSPVFIRAIREGLVSMKKGRATRRWYADLYGYPNRRGLDELRGYLRSMKDETTARDIEFGVVLFPLMAGDGSSYVFTEIHGVMSGILEEEGIAFTDITGEVLSEPAQNLWVHPSDHHPNMKAHENAAEAVKTFLDKEIFRVRDNE